MMPKTTRFSFAFLLAALVASTAAWASEYGTARGTADEAQAMVAKAVAYFDEHGAKME